MPKLLTLEDANFLTTDEIRRLHMEHLNSGLIQLMKLVKFDRCFVRAEGASVWDQEGKEYLDFLGGYGALNLGHNPPEVLEAIHKVIGAPNILHVGLSRYAAVLAHNLVQVAPGKLQRAFFCNSGAEAVEAALKFARATTGKPVILSLEGSFHGKTMGALALTGKRQYQKPFDPMLPCCEVLPFGEASTLENRLRRGDVAAFIVEPILGEGGVKLHPTYYLESAARLCRQHGVLLILDEVQTGFGRTGKLFAAEHDKIEPDIMCLAKSLGGGVMPIGATLTTDTVWQKAMGGMNKCLRHTSTFGGMTSACVAGIAALETIINKNLPNQAAQEGEYLLGRLRELQIRFPFIKEVRGKGLLIGIEFDSGGLVGKAAYEFLGSMIAGRLLNDHRIITAYTLNNPTVVRVEPPLIVTREQIDYFLESLARVIEANSSAMKLLASTGGGIISDLVRGRKPT